MCSILYGHFFCILFKIYFNILDEIIKRNPDECIDQHSFYLLSTKGLKVAYHYMNVRIGPIRGAEHSVSNAVLRRFAIELKIIGQC